MERVTAIEPAWPAWKACPSGSWDEPDGDALLVESTGNFAFPSARGLSANSAVFVVELSEDGLDLRVVPVRVPGGVASIPDDDVAAEILDQIESHSTGWILDDNGMAVAAPDHEGRC